MSSKQIDDLKSKALDLFASENFDELHNCLVKIVELDDPWGMHYLAGTYTYGNGVPRDQSSDLSGFIGPISSRNSGSHG